MAPPEQVEQKLVSPKTEDEAFRQSVLDLCRAVTFPGSGSPCGAFASIGNIAKALPDMQLVDVASKIKDLGDDRFPVRERASAQLEKLGAVALPQLVLAQKNPDLEVARRAGRLVEKLIWGNLPELEARINQPIFRFLDSRSDADIRKQFESAIKDIDAVAADPKKVKARQEELAAVKQHVKLDQYQTDSVERQTKELDNINRLSGEGRVQFALYLLSSGCPEEARRNLSAAMDKYPKLTGDHSFMKVVCATGADQDPKFAQSFAKHGGSTEELQKVKEEKPIAVRVWQGASNGLQTGVDKLKTGTDELKKELNKFFKKKSE